MLHSEPKELPYLLITFYCRIKREMEEEKFTHAVYIYIYKAVKNLKQLCASLCRFNSSHLFQI